MPNHFHKPRRQAVNAPLTEFERFAQVMLDNPILKHTGTPRSKEKSEADLIRERELLEWAASFSNECEEELHALLRAEARLEESQRLQQFADSLLEQDWNPSKHPRRGGPPNAGWWASAGGTGQGSLTGRRVSVTTTSYKASQKSVFQQASWHPPVGHHWTPYSVIFSDDVRPFLSDEAVQYAMGSYSGPTETMHRNGTYGGITHPQYNDFVKTELKTFIKRHKIKQMTAEQMRKFVGLINNGLGANGKTHRHIAAFNAEINATIRKGVKPASKMEDVLAAGRKHMKTSRFRLLAAGAIASGLLGDVLQNHLSALEVAGKSGHYQRALRALHQGDIALAHMLLLGDKNSLYMEILLHAGPHAALNFKAAMEAVFEHARMREYK